MLEDIGRCVAGPPLKISIEQLLTLKTNLYHALVNKLPRILGLEFWLVKLLIRPYASG